MASKPLSDVAGVILAGGLSRRMGQDKAFAQLAGRPLIAHCIDALWPQVQMLAINANGPADRFARFGFPVLPDPIRGNIGPLAGILAALEWAKGLGFSLIVTVPVDTPFLPPDFVAKLKTALSGNELVCAQSGDRRHFAAALFRTHLADDLRKAIETENLRKVEDWQARHEAGVAEWISVPADPFFNINTFEDLVEAKRRLGGGME
jgi:molybdopterin-guanine dinucleotide biosynthesis protein A